MRLGIDVGSTTVKLVFLDDDNNIIYSRYERHMSNAFLKVQELIKEAHEEFGDQTIQAVITGSGGLSIAKLIKVPFEQEVISCSKAVQTLIPKTDTAIELGGEDAKITFYGQTIEQRMNGTCAGGTGAFIDQMAVLLNTDADGLNEASKNHTLIYPIAARCGVFAKTDIQPLINDGARIENIAALRALTREKTGKEDNKLSPFYTVVAEVYYANDSKATVVPQQYSFQLPLTCVAMLKNQF